MTTLNSSPRPLAAKGLPHTKARIDRAKHLRSQVEEKSQHVIACDGSSIDLDSKRGQVTLESSIPKPTSFGRYFTNQEPVNAEVSFDPKSEAVKSAKIAHVHEDYYESKEKFEKTTLDDGSAHYEHSRSYRTGEILEESYTFHPNGTITLHTIPPFVDHSPC